MLLFCTRTLAVLYGLLAALLALLGSFADGGDTVTHVLLSFVQPMAALGLLAAAFVADISRGLLALVAAALLAAALGLVYVAVSIASGEVTGEWQLPAALAVAPALGFLLTLARLRSAPPSRG